MMKYLTIALSAMKKLAMLCLLLCSIYFPATSQITITNAVFPAIGDTLHYAYGNQPGAINQIFTPPGGDQHWDLSNLQPSQLWDQVMRNPATGNYNGYFPSASVLFNPYNSNDEVYWQVTGNQVLDLGYFGLDQLGMNLNLLFRNIPGLEKAWAPVNFFDIKQTAGNVLTAFPASQAPPVLINLVPTADSFRIRITHQIIGAMDAYGTLTIPGGTFDVLRKKQTEYRSMAIDVKVQPLGWIDISTIGGQQLFPLGTDTITTFQYLNNESKEAIAICTLNTAQNEVTGVQYKVVSTPTATFSPANHVMTATYPNPVRNTLYGHFEIESPATVQLRLFNVQGNMVREQRMEACAGINDFSIPADNLVPGVYELMLVRDGIFIGSARVVKE